MAPAAPAAPQKQTSQFKLRAQARGLVLPDDDNGAAAQSGPVVWDGRAFVLAKGDERCAREAFTYCHGQRMVGQTEQPCASTTKLVAGRHRFVNAPDNSKEGYLWRPGNRYTHRNLKIDSNIDGEAVLSAGRFVPYLTDKDGLSYKSGPLMWSEHRFRDVPGQMGHADYEAMCARLAETTRWDKSRPPAQCEPGYAAYTRRPGELHTQQDEDVRPAPPGTHKIREPSGESTVVPDTAHLAPEHGATLLVPAQRGAVPDGPASFAVHKTPQADLRWLTRVTSQRTSGNVPIRGPGEVPYFEAKCPEFGESRGILTTTGVQ